MEKSVGLMQLAEYKDAEMLLNEYQNRIKVHAERNKGYETKYSSIRKS
jgi:hypothetical protein